MLIVIFLLIFISILLVIHICHAVNNEIVNGSKSIINKQGSTKTSSLRFSEEKEAVLPVRVTGRKNGLIKRTDSNSNNMNCDKYLFSAKFSQTGRIRTKQKVIIFKGDDLYEEIKKMGFEEPISITSSEWEQPSEAQISYMRNVGVLTQPTGICSIDASCILSTYETKIGIAPEDLYQYATNHRVITSYYAPEDYLYENIWNTLDGKEKINFFVFCVYRDRVHYKGTNLDLFSKRKLIYEISDKLYIDESFVKSMDKYDARDIMTFGESKTVGDTCYYVSGGSKNTIAYRSVIEMLKRKGLIS